MAQTKHRDDQLFVGPVEFDGAVDFDGTTLFNAAANHGSNGVVRTGRQLFVPAADAIAGATAGWLVTGANDNLARLPASKTNSTLVIPLKGLHIGDTLTAVSITGQVESAGNIATLAIDIRKSTAAVADFTDASLDTDASGDLTADTLITAAGTPIGVAALGEVLAEGESLYALITGTTAASTDIAVAGLLMTYNQA
jgi:hypothetical protein